ncbi:MAG: efflux RND transporter permease subunit [Phycisphaerae bacterium]
MFSLFFIDRPVFAAVISIFIVLAGSLALTQLPVENMPDITPPTVMVSATYPGASASTVAETVALPLEKQINGVEGMLYLSSTSSSDGSASITVTFDVGTDIDMATVLVQNRVAMATPSLPEEVQRLGIVTRKRSTTISQVICMNSPDGSLDDVFISNYTNINVVDALKRVDGVGEVTVFGAKDFSMRIWLNPDKLKARNITSTDVIAAIREQNIEVAPGIIGGEPAPKEQQLHFTINARGRLNTVDEFENIIVKRVESGAVLRVRDVAKVELGTESYDTNVKFNGENAIAVGIYQLPGANALAVARGVIKKMEEVKEYFPEGLSYSVAYDPSKFISRSISELSQTLLITVILVILTVYIFLQDLRATIIPALTIPVSLIGTFIVMNMLGLSVNTLSLFGLVLAIGVVVDDSIVVVENTQRIIDEEGLSSREAAKKSMIQIFGAVIATTLVLLAVFVPTALISGISGRLYRQFAITISTATVFSSLNALTLSPALCALLLRPSPERRALPFRLFNNGLQRVIGGYGDIVHAIVRRSAISLVVFAILGVLTVKCFQHVPGGFIPTEDQGMFLVSSQLPDGATLGRTQEVSSKVNAILKDNPAVQFFVTINGLSLVNSTHSNNSATWFIQLKDWAEREKMGLDINHIVSEIQGKLMGITDAYSFAFVPPPIVGLSVTGGFEMQLEDKGGAGIIALQEAANNLTNAASATGNLEKLNASIFATVPQVKLKVDREKAKKLGVRIDDIFNCLSASLGSAYVNDFNLFGQTFKVKMMADKPFRDKLNDIYRLRVRNESGDMVPLETLLTAEDSAGPDIVTHHNMYTSAKITGSPIEGLSSMQAIDIMKKTAAKSLPGDIGYEWSGTTFQELAAGNTAAIIFALAVVFAFLFLAAQYESWTTPLSIVLTVPIAIFGGIGYTWVRAMENNIYTQIGFVLLVALASKNAILLVEFAEQLRREGMDIYSASVKASKLRFRPIQMTAFTFILGIFPMVFATGAGSASRQSLGTTVFGGMLMASIIGIIFIPALYVVVEEIFLLKGKKLPETETEQDQNEDATT